MDCCRSKNKLRPSPYLSIIHCVSARRWHVVFTPGGYTPRAAIQSTMDTDTNRFTRFIDLPTEKRLAGRLAGWSRKLKDVRASTTCISHCSRQYVASRHATSSHFVFAVFGACDRYRSCRSFLDIYIYSTHPKSSNTWSL